VALIRRRRDEQILYLTQWNPRWHALHFVSGHKRPEECFGECLVREVGEELGLSEGIDFAVAPQPLAQLRFEAWSESARVMTSYEFTVYEVALIGGTSTIEQVAANPDNRWVAGAEIHAGRCGDGTPISPTTARVLTALEPNWA
jgi:hypothetical protein